MDKRYNMMIFIMLFSLFDLVKLVSSLTSSIINIDNVIYSKTNVNLIIEKKGNYLYEMTDMFLPSDLINRLIIGDEFELQVIQGSLNVEHKSTFYSFDISKNQNKLSNYPSGFFLHSNSLNPFNDVERFKTFFELFINTFKFTLTPLLDRTEFIIIDNQSFLIENKEKVCIEHLDAIKESLPSYQWNQYLNSVNYQQFTYSDYKSIKYHIHSSENQITFDFEIISRVIKQENKQLPISSEKYTNEVLLSSHRYLEGIRFNFENFVFHHIISFDQGYTFQTLFQAHQSLFKFVEIIPAMLNPLYSTMKISFYSNKTLVRELQAEELSQLFDIDIVEGIENQYPQVPFSYEKKKTKKIYIHLKDMPHFPFDYMEFTMIIKKTIINFESLENEEEFGYVMPCGIITLGKKYTITNQVYFNIPNIDITMPFNIIAVSWLIFGFMFVQILNIYLGKTKGKSFLDSIKERFLAKWGFLWGR